jgi:hypothetical protein
MPSIGYGTAPLASRLRRAIDRVIAAVAALGAAAMLATLAAALAGHHELATAFAICSLTCVAAIMIAVACSVAVDLKPGTAALPGDAGIWESNQEVDDFIRDTYAARSGAAASGLTLAAYQAGARTTARYPEQDLLGLYYAALGLAGEAGEIANKVKKVIRDDGETLTDEARTAIAGELGDALWYAAALAHELGVPSRPSRPATSRSCATASTGARSPAAATADNAPNLGAPIGADHALSIPTGGHLWARFTSPRP